MRQERSACLKVETVRSRDSGSIVGSFSHLQGSQLPIQLGSARRAKQHSSCCTSVGSSRMSPIGRKAAAVVAGSQRLQSSMDAYSTRVGLEWSWRRVSCSLQPPRKQRSRKVLLIFVSRFCTELTHLSTSIELFRVRATVYVQSSKRRDTELTYSGASAEDPPPCAPWCLAARVPTPG